MEIDWKKMQGLVPAIIQDADSLQVLMLGYMDKAAYNQTLTSGWVTFYSRSKQRLWMKGESSGNRLKLIKHELDCDQDSLLFLVKPDGPCCHNGTESCFVQAPKSSGTTLHALEALVLERKADPQANSYTTQLFNDGVKRIAQKVGEEGVETALAAVAGNCEELHEEAADLLYHLLVLLTACDTRLEKVLSILQERSKK